jgi:hypothetical protein
MLTDRLPSVDIFVSEIYSSAAITRLAMYRYMYFLKWHHIQV